MPSAHRRHADWTPARLRREAAAVGPATAGWSRRSCAPSRIPEQGFRACLGILAWCAATAPARVEAACQRGLDIGARSYGSVASILRNGLDRAFAPEPVPDAPPVRHGEHPRRRLLPLRRPRCSPTPPPSGCAASASPPWRRPSKSSGASRSSAGLGFEDRLALLVDREATGARRPSACAPGCSSPACASQACVEDVDWRAARGLDRALFQRLAAGEWIDRHQGLLLTGPTGIGKTWLACALGHKACRDNRSVLYQRLPRLLEALGLARGDGRYARMLKSLARVQLLILDDWGLTPLTAEQRRDLLEIVDDRHGRAATIVTSQVPVPNWHEWIADPTLGDAILDRLVHSAHRIELKGESMRQRAARRATAVDANQDAEPNHHVRRPPPPRLASSECPAGFCGTGGWLRYSGSNALATGELVVNMVSGRLAEAMNLTCIDAPPGVDEAALAGLATLPSERVAPPRLADSPVAFECRLHQAIEPGPNQVILLARILLAHVAPSCLTDTEPPAIDTPALDLIGGLHGARWYTRTSDRFAMDRPSWAEWTTTRGGS